MHKLTESSSPEHAFVPNLKLEANNSAAAAATTQSGDKQQLPCPQQEQRNFLPLASGELHIPLHLVFVLLFMWCVCVCACVHACVCTGDELVCILQTEQLSMTNFKVSSIT